MIRVALIFFPSNRWLGGVSYMKNLFTSVYALPDRKLQFFLFVGRNTKYERLSDIEKYVTVERTSYFDQQQQGMKGFLGKIYPNLIQRTKKIEYIEYLFRKHRINICMHSWRYNTSPYYKTVNWIPDFQHLHLPQFFSKEEIAYRNKKYFETIQYSDCIIVNSKDVFKDVKRFAPQYIKKVKILPFVATFDHTVYASDMKDDFGRSMPEKYFFVPNQFWQHKNHLTVIKAAYLLKKKGVHVQVLCAGNTQDFRKSDYISSIENAIKKYGLQNQVRILGVLAHNDVLRLMRNSVSVINPSLFEGWSTSVEEAKSLGKNIILSDIAVHREQHPDSALYFDPLDAGQLAKHMEKNWKTKKGGPDYALEKKVMAKYKKRMQEFGSGYQKILLDVVKEA